MTSEIKIKCEISDLQNDINQFYNSINSCMYWDVSDLLNLWNVSYLIVYYWNYNKICLKWQLFKQGLFLQFNFGTILKLWYFSIHFVMAFNAVVHVTLLSDWRAPNICWLWVINAATLNNILMISLRSVILLVEETGTRGAKTCLYPRNMLDV